MKSTEGIVAAIFAGSALSLLTWMSDAHSNKVDKRLLQENLQFLELPEDTTKEDKSQKSDKYKPSTRPTYKPKDRYGDPLGNPPSKSPLLLKDPSNVNQKVELGEDGKSFEIQEKVGNVDYRPPTRMTYDQFTKLRNQELRKNYWKATSAGKEAESPTSTKSLIPKIYMSPLLDRLFGGNTIDVKPNGTIMLDFGGRYQRTDNPSIPVQQQRVGQFWFDQQIAFNIQAKIGERLTLRANWDTKATFDFDNNIKLQYKAQEEDIIQNIEAGNVSMPSGTTLIQGAQNLFGVKTYLRFGKLWITSVFANQRGKTDELVIPGGTGGALSREAEIRADNYEDNRHYFLGQYFRDNFEKSLQTLPYITSGVNVTRVEVYVTNRNNNTSTLRNIVAFTDLGEKFPMDSTQHALKTASRGNFASNQANTLYGTVSNDVAVRASANTQDVLSAKYGYVQGTNFEVVKGARKLEEGRDFTVNRLLGYISLTSPLRNDDVLAVAYEYDARENGNFTVGELSETYQNLPDGNSAIFKLLRPTVINTNIPLWNLQMKNVYSLGSTQISRRNFQLRLIYRDDFSGIDNPSLQTGQGRTNNNRNLVELFGADKLNMNGDPQADGSFDFVPGATVDTVNGRVIFPVLEPFGAKLQSTFVQTTDLDLINKFCFFELYRKTKPDAQQVALKNKFFLKYRTQSSLGGSEIQLPGLNIAENSVVVTAGSRVLTMGTDYTVNYQTGKVNIINQGVLSSGSEIRIRFERADLFNFRTKGFFGSRFEYRWNKNFNIGATIFNMNERPLIQRVALGDEPINNTIWGLDFNYKKDSRFITRLVDFLPLISTKEVSAINASGEVAQILPSPSPFIPGNGISFIDDFEGQETPFDLTRPATRWVTGSTPKDPGLGLQAQSNGLGVNYNRAKLAWYNIDNVFYLPNTPNKPSNISNEDLKYHYTRAVSPQEIYQNRSVTAGIAFEPTLDLAFYPNERGSYNYTPNLNRDGTLKNPQNNFGSISRGILTNTDFDDANIQYLEFWMMDPFIQGEYGKIMDGSFNDNNTTGGQMIFQLGSVSEDVIPDGRMGFENGLSTNQDLKGIETDLTAWGRVTRQSYNLNAAAFSNVSGARSVQDVGFDGVRSNGSDEERTTFANYLNVIDSLVSPEVYNQIAADPSNDDFKYYLGNDLDGDPTMKILKRYKRFNHTENNSPINPGNVNFNPSSYQNPDIEDINNNNTLDQLEQYFQYKLNIRPGLQEAKKYIVSKVDYSVPDPNGNGTTYDNVTWYQMRIPLRENPEKINGINSFKAIRFIRTVLTGFSQPVVLRMAQFQLVGSQWRVVPDSLELLEKGLFFGPPEPAQAYVSSVNVEENGRDAGLGIPYVIPPRGFSRDRDNTSTITRQLNEQSLRLCVDNLRERDAKMAFKTVLNMNLINYSNIQMFLHAHGQDLKTNDKELVALFRIGTDLVQNYYEVEIPLKVTAPNTPASNPDAIWPEENDLNIAIEDLTAAKIERNTYPGGYSMFKTFTTTRNGRVINLKGNPDITSVQVLGIGVKNPAKLNDRSAKSVCIWANELRLSGYNQKVGTAAIGRVDTKLADFGTLSASTRYIGIGFGSIEQKISQRVREETFGFSIASNMSLDKFTPSKWGLKLPLYMSYDIIRITPEFDPLNPDVKLKNSLATISDANTRAEYERLVIDNTERRSINMTNIQKVRTGQQKTPLPTDIENFNLTLAYSDQNRRSITIAQYTQQIYKLGIGYNYTLSPKSVVPFKFVKAKYLKFISEFNFNPTPSGLALRLELNRSFTKTQLRSTGGSATQTGIFQPGANLTTQGISPIYEKTFTMTRTYAFQWSLAKSLNFNYSANALAVIDEPVGDINKDQAAPNSKRTKEDSVLYNLSRFGRTRNFTQTMGLDYTLPLDKFPITDFISATARYSTSTIWTSGPVGIRDSLGNNLQNSREQALNGKIDLLKLYNKVPFLKNINNPPPPPPKNPEPSADGKKPEKEEKPAPEYKFLKEILRSIMRLNTINGSYSLTEGTLIPGYLKTPTFIGFDNNFVAPGWPFILGSQNRQELTQQFENNGWISKSTLFNQPLTQQRNENISFRTSWEPVKTFVIQADVKRTSISNYQENIRYRLDTVDNVSKYLNFGQQRTGSFTTTFNTFLTAFYADDPQTNLNAAFSNFRTYRRTIRDRLYDANEKVTPSDTGAYRLNSQDVLIPAFLAAYSGADPNKQNLNAFPKIPLPNWRIDFSGLSNLEFMKRWFTSFTITHSYTSTYSVNNYSSKLRYNDSFIGLNNREWDTPLPELLDSNKRLVPVYIIGQVSIAEQFGPLAGINFRTKTNFTGRLEYRQGRNIALNINNAQVTEQQNKDFVIGMGYSKSNLKLPFRVNGRDVILKNEVVFRFDFSYRDSKTVQRKLDSDSGDGPGVQLVTLGTETFQIKPNISYQVSQRLNLQLYYDHTITVPRISNSFLRVNINFGIQLRFSLS